jgi:diguanylate cyclase (GGDEF)-like protein/PAS domain S-box-containing protein
MNDRETDLRVMQAGAMDFISKDLLTPDFFEKSIRYALERFQTEKELRESKKMMEEVINSIPQYLFWKDRECRYLGCNEKFAQISGVSSSEEIVGKTDYELSWTQSQADSFRQCDLRVMDQKKSEMHIIEPKMQVNGKRSWMDTNRVPVLNDRGKCIGILGTFEDITDRVKMEESLQFQRVAIETSLDGMAIIDKHHQFTYVNQAFSDYYGFLNPRQLLGKTWFHLYSDAELGRIEREILPRFIKSGQWRGEALGCRMDGREFIQEMTLTALEDGGMTCVIRDISHRKEAEEALRTAEEKYRNIFENAVEGVYQSSMEGRFISANPSMARIFGYHSSEDFINSIYNIAEDLFVLPSTREHFLQQLKSEGVAEEFQYEAYRKDGTIIWISENARLVHHSNGSIRCIEGTVEDITRKKQTERTLYHLAYFDSLTGLPNRTLMLKHLQDLLHTEGEANTYTGLFLLDLDRFKVINDSLGPAAGDTLIKDVAIRLKQFASDHMTIYRMGGDEFAIILRNAKSHKELDSYAEDIQHAILKPFYVFGQEIFTSASIGSVLNDLGYTATEHLLRAADTAMFKAKRKGGSLHETFQESMYKQALNRLHMENEIRKAIEENHFSVFYQPIIRVKDQVLVGFEALARWKHIEKGFISPAEFIPVSEETGLIIPLGKWILETACNQCRKWQIDGRPDLFASVNVSVKQFQNRTLPLVVEEIIGNLGMEAKTLKLEITESTAMKNVDYTVGTLQDLSKLGVIISIDDFGTGYSSLAYLKKFPFNNLKIDQTFIHDINSSSDDAALVRAITAMAHSLNLDVTAEGVETIDQYKFLQKIEVGYLQGYLFGRPMPPADFECWMNSYIPGSVIPD